MDLPAVGTFGRALTTLAPSGQVEVDGVVFQAETSMFGMGPKRAPISPDRAVVVSGWRLDKQDNVVLLVADPAAPAPEPGPAPAELPLEQPAPPSADERIALLERQIVLLAQGFNSRVLPAPATEPTNPASGGAVGWLLLTFGQIVSALGCVATPIYALMALSQAAAVRERVRDAPNLSVWIVLAALLAFLYSAAMFVVFSRAKRVHPD